MFSSRVTQEPCRKGRPTDSAARGGGFDRSTVDTEVSNRQHMELYIAALSHREALLYFGEMDMNVVPRVTNDVQ
jgi:hypothetical protein